MTNFTMKKRIMFSVYVIYLMRKLSAPFILEALMLLTLLSAMFLFVSVPSVLSNMFSSGHLYHYFLTAFSTTELFVQSILVLTGVTLLLFMKNIVLSPTIREGLASVLSFIYSPFLVK